MSATPAQCRDASVSSSPSRLARSGLAEFRHLTQTGQLLLLDQVVHLADIEVHVRISDLATRQIGQARIQLTQSVVRNA